MDDEKTVVDRYFKHMKPEILQKIKPGAKIKVREKNGGIFEGLVLGRKHGSEAGATFTVRATVAGVGVEKVYPVYSPNILKVDILSSPKKIKKSKLYFLRDLSQRKIQQKLGVK